MSDATHNEPAPYRRKHSTDYDMIKDISRASDARADEALVDDETKDVVAASGLAANSTKGTHTVFIHKLYNMLEDAQIRHLIWWTAADDGFYLIPGEEFSKVLSQYFKHTNIASFIRQLNMYGFHKVNDLFHSLTSEVTKWEFRHLSGNFRKGDLEGLKAIKRRSLKNTHSHREVVSLKALPANGMDISGADSPVLVADYSDVESRSNSVIDMQYTGAAVPGEPASLNARLGELGHSLAALRHEHARLQSRYDTAVDDLKKTNLDMAHLVDIVLKMIDQRMGDKLLGMRSSTSSSHSHSGKPGIPERVATPVLRKLHDDDMASPTSGMKPDTLRDTLEREIMIFRNSVMQRAAAYETIQSQTHMAHYSGPRPLASRLNERLQQPRAQSYQAYAYQPQQQRTNSAVTYAYPPDPNMGFQQVRFGSTSGSQRHMSVLYDPLAPAPSSQRNSITTPGAAQPQVIYSPIAMVGTTPTATGHPGLGESPVQSYFEAKRHMSQLELTRVYSPLNGDLAPTSIPTAGSQPTSMPGNSSGPVSSNPTWEAFAARPTRPASASSNGSFSRDAAPDVHFSSNSRAGSIQMQLYQQLAQQPEVTVYIPRTYPYNVPHQRSGSHPTGYPVQLYPSLASTTASHLAPGWHTRYASAESLQAERPAPPGAVPSPRSDSNAIQQPPRSVPTVDVSVPIRCDTPESPTARGPQARNTIPAIVYPALPSQLQPAPSIRKLPSVNSLTSPPANSGVYSLLNHEGKDEEKIEKIEKTEGTERTEETNEKNDRKRSNSEGEDQDKKPRI
ncbi:hypothetical protein BABINDRAFT_163511 [Babjeviella inositovora NRRL Y-12698]|uniref:Heat shock transcription factor n=1 Tax=Babjeviella inositovora NRRL Y-12698 TaxID=984486 RepID=A0A1E3QIG4_9ASCO|nr:uncharacterized protein BABINDRAFT_163511 [Babjeviella inositovora NRRL Y-12698]ODQ77503.1 hypothetical protein BABINDRAFT_163511 [Babjeviella inositovora NRRL Y-12698]